MAKKEAEAQILGMSPIDSKKKFKLTLTQRSKLAEKGQSISKVKEVMTGAELSKFPQWKTLGLLEEVKTASKKAE